MIAILAINLAAIMAVLLILWRMAVAIRDVSFIDAVWAYGMVGLALATAVQVGLPRGEAGWACLALTMIWGLRLGTHLLLRWQRLGRDPRYEAIVGGAMRLRGWTFATAALVMVFGLQGPLLWLASLPAQVGIIADPGGPMADAGWFGVAVALFGIGFEALADAQLEAFRKDPANKGRVLDTGLWRYTRHPNYFGDAVSWWGIWIVASSAGAGWWTIAAPIFLTWTLTRWSGRPILEKSLKASRPGYAAYVARTSGFFPWPPKAP